MGSDSFLPGIEGHVSVNPHNISFPQYTSTFAGAMITVCQTNVTRAGFITGEKWLTKYDV